MPKLEVDTEAQRRSDLVELLVTLADQNGITPQDVLTHEPCWFSLREYGVEIGTYTTMMVHEAQSKMKQGVRRSIARVDEINQGALQVLGMSETHVAEDGDVKPIRKRVEPAIQRTRREGNGGGSMVEILGYPSTGIIRTMGSLGFGFTSARRALDDLGGVGIADSTIKSNLWRGKKGEDIIDLPDDKLAELVAYIV